MMRLFTVGCRMSFCKIKLSKVPSTDALEVRVHKIVEGAFFNAPYVTGGVIGIRHSEKCES